MERAGAMLESFVANELVRQGHWVREPMRAFHYRDQDRREVDIVLEHADGTIVAIEVKSTVSLRGRDVSSLEHLRQRVGRRFRAGIVLHPGEQTLPFGDRVWAVPIAALWS